MRPSFIPVFLSVVFAHGAIIWHLSSFKLAPPNKEHIVVQTVTLKPRPQPKVVTVASPKTTNNKKVVQKTPKKKKVVKKAKQKPSSSQKATVAQGRSGKKKSGSKPKYAAKQSSPNWQTKLTQTLYEQLDFPEFGKVKAKLEILGNGQIEMITILQSESDKNEAYLKKALIHITLPKWSSNPKAKETFVITFANQVD